MELEIVSCYENHKFNKSGSFCHIYTTHPVEPFFVKVDLATIPCRVTVPTNRQYDALIIELYEIYESEEGRHIYNHAGACFMCCKDFGNSGTVKAQLSDEDGGGTGFVELKPSVLPMAQELYPNARNVRRMCATSVADSSQWVHAMAPLSQELVKVHVPRFACRFDHMPGHWFAIQTPSASEDEQLFKNALHVAANRRFVNLNEQHGSDASFASIVFEAIAAIPNSYVYNADIKIGSNGKGVSIERFSADSRVLHNGDCEDEAREIITLCNSLKTGNYNSPECTAAQKLLKQYVCCQCFSAVALGSDPSLAVYSTGGSLYAHSHNLFLPANYAQSALERSGSSVRLNGVRQISKDLPVLAADGISLFDAKPLNADHPAIAPSGLRKTRDMRIKKMDLIGDEYYMFLCSFFCVDEFVAPSGTPVHELYFQSQNNSGHAVYGARYTDVIEMEKTIKIKETHIMTQQENQMAEECMRYFHPIVPYTVKNGVDMHILETTLDIKRGERPRNSKGNFFLSAFDTQDETYLKDLKKRMQPGTWVYALDYFAEDCYTVQLYLL